MSQIPGFEALKVGQLVKVEGRFEGGKLAALEISLKDPDDDTAIEGPIQSIDYEKNVLRIMDRDIRLPGGVAIKDRQRNDTTLKSIKPGDTVKLKGKYSAASGLVPEKIKIQEVMSSKVQEVQGVIDKIDRENKTLNVIGFTIVANEKTTIEA